MDASSAGCPGRSKEVEFPKEVLARRALKTANPRRTERLRWPLQPALQRQPCRPQRRGKGGETGRERNELFSWFRCNAGRAERTKAATRRQRPYASARCHHTFKDAPEPAVSDRHISSNI